MPSMHSTQGGRADGRLLLLVGLALGAAGGYWVGSTRRGNGHDHSPPSSALPSPRPPAQVPSPSTREPTLAPVTEAERSKAVEAGLGWLARAQEHDGSWELVKWNPWHGRTGLYGFTEEDHWFQPAATGLALLAWLEAAPASGALAEGTLRGLARLVAWQREDGRIGFDEEEVDEWFRRMLGVPGLSGHGSNAPGYKALTIHSFNHAVAMAALASAARRADGEAWREPARRALAHAVADEHPEYRWSAYLDPEADIGVVAFVALAARAGADAGLTADSRPLLDALPDFLERVTDPATGRTRMLSDNPACFDGDDSTAINAYARRLLGQAPGSAPLARGLASVAASEVRWREAVLPPAEGPSAFHAHLGPVVNHDAWTYGIRALEGAPGPRAAAWRATVRALLARNQVADGSQAGSWEPIGVWDRVGGRLYATAMAVRALAGP